MDAKKGILALVVVFVGFWMFTDPQGLADITKSGAGNGWSIMSDAFNAVIRFVGELN